MDEKDTHRLALSSSDLEQAAGNESLAEKKAAGLDTRFNITVISYRKGKHDPDGIAVKACLDGLVRAGLLQDDSTEEINKAADEFRMFLTVEMSCGQMVEDVKLAVAGKSPVVFHGRPGGGVPTVDEILEKIRQLTLRAKTPV